jgi:antitoxin component of MazEF toxin-antitoxin module
MPLIRKVVQLGKGRAIILPSQWLQWVESESGEPLREVLLEIDNNIVVIPLIRKKEMKEGAANG